MDLLADFEAIGFTEYEAKVYVALLREHPATGYQLGKAAGIPRSMVYEALGRLNARGAVLKTEEDRSTLYRPVPPDALLERYDLEQRRRLQNLRDGLQAIYTAQAESRFWSISGRSSVVSYAAKMIAGAQHEIVSVLADADLEELGQALAEAQRRDVAVSALLTGRGELPGALVARHPRQESQLQQLGDSLLVAVDGDQVLIATAAPETTAAITNNRNLVFVARQFVWMELFAQRVYTRLGADLLARLDPEDRAMIEGLGQPDEATRESAPGAAKTAARVRRSRR